MLNMMPKKNYIFDFGAPEGGGAAKVSSDIENVLFKKYNIFRISPKLKNKNKFSRFPEFLFWYIKILFEIVCKRPFLCIHHNNVWFLIWYFLPFFPKKSIFVVHTSIIEDRETSSGKKWLSKFALKKCTKIVCVSDGLVNEVVGSLGISPKKVVRIYNYCRGLRRISKGKGLDGLDVGMVSVFKNQYFLCVGRFSRQKNYADVLPLIPYQQCALVIITNNKPDKEFLEAACKLDLKVSYDLTDPCANIFILSGLSQKEIYIWMNRALAVLGPSLWEGFGIFLAEAVLSDANVIANNCPHGPLDIYNLSGGNPTGRFRLIDLALRGAINQIAWRAALEDFLNAPSNLSEYSDEIFIMTGWAHFSKCWLNIVDSMPNNIELN